jgi:16S rRNA (cytosine967-C5)-methyltransferase
MLGALRRAEHNLDAVFTGQGFAPAPVSEAERSAFGAEGNMPDAVRLDLPDWAFEMARESLQGDLAAACEALQSRAPVYLRVNSAKTDRAAAIAALADEAIIAQPSDLAATALLVTDNARRVSQSRAYQDGSVELQDAASQAVLAGLPQAQKVLDYCAGGGGKALALAATGADVFAHDVDPDRMRDLPARAARAGVHITQVSAKQARSRGPYDMVLCDVPCSGSGAWRRSPDGKWRLTPDRLQRLLSEQAKILDSVAGLVAEGGALVYVTCSIFDAENKDQVAQFVQRNSSWKVAATKRYLPHQGGDGFFVAVLRRD